MVLVQSLLIENCARDVFAEAFRKKEIISNLNCSLNNQIRFCTRKIPGVVKRSPRYAWRLASLFSQPMDCRRLPMVLVDSSTARIPLPGAAILAAVWRSSSLYLSKDLKSTFINMHIDMWPNVSEMLFCTDDQIQVGKSHANAG